MSYRLFAIAVFCVRWPALVSTCHLAALNEPWYVQVPDPQSDGPTFTFTAHLLQPFRAAVGVLLLMKSRNYPEPVRATRSVAAPLLEGSLCRVEAQLGAEGVVLRGLDSPLVLACAGPVS